ncbi:MAG TPA: hypothetical protein VGV92_03860 [Gammaproteobacteria bacterium]|nr:hypothetical protein [Gammaproteobacteria bacterium]
MKSILVKASLLTGLFFFSLNSVAEVSSTFTIALPTDMKVVQTTRAPIVKGTDYYSEYVSQSEMYGSVSKQFIIHIYTPTETWPTHLWDQIKTQWEEVMEVPLESQLVKRAIDHLNLSKRANITEPQIFTMNNQTYSISYVAVDATQITVMATRANNFYYVITLTSTSGSPTTRTEQMNDLLNAVRGMTFTAPYWNNRA